MRIDPARQERPAAGVDGFVRGRGPGRGAEPGNPLAFDHHCGVAEDAVVRVLGHEFGDIGDQGAHGTILQRRMDQRVAASASAVRDAGLAARAGSAAGVTAGTGVPES